MLVYLFVVCEGGLLFCSSAGTNTETHTSRVIEDCAIQQLPQKKQVSQVTWSPPSPPPLEQKIFNSCPILPIFPAQNLTKTHRVSSLTWVALLRSHQNKEKMWNVRIQIAYQRPNQQVTSATPEFLFWRIIKSCLFIYLSMYLFIYLLVGHV